MENYYKDNTLGTSWIGKVIDINDPLKIGRVKVSVFGKYDSFDNESIPFAFPLFKNGEIVIPNIGDYVNVCFENGDEYVPFYTSVIKLNDTLKSSIEDDYPNIMSVAHNNINGKQVNIIYTQSKGLLIQVNKNLLNITQDDKIIISNDIQSIELNDNISIGTLSKSSESAVLGETLENILNELLKDIGMISAISTPSGVSASINTSPQWSILENKFKQKFKKFKSKIVTLD